MIPCLAHCVSGVAQLLEGGGEELVLEAQPGGHAGRETLVLPASPVGISPTQQGCTAGSTLGLDVVLVQNDPRPV